MTSNEIDTKDSSQRNDSDNESNSVTSENTNLNNVTLDETTNDNMKSGKDKEVNLGLVNKNENEINYSDPIDEYINIEMEFTDNDDKDHSTEIPTEIITIKDLNLNNASNKLVITSEIDKLNNNVLKGNGVCMEDHGDDFVNIEHENCDRYNDVFEKVGGGDRTSTAFDNLSESEIMILFPQEQNRRCRNISFLFKDDENLNNRSVINIPYKEYRSTSMKSISLIETATEISPSEHRFVSTIASIEMKNSDITEVNVRKKRWSYNVDDQDLNEKTLWKYNPVKTKQSCTLSIQVIEDPNTKERWESEFVEYESAKKGTVRTVQQESEWVLVDCSKNEVKVFNEHEGECRVRNCNHKDHDKPCVVS